MAVNDASSVYFIPASPYGASAPIKDIKVSDPLPAEERAGHAAMEPGGPLLA